MSDEPFTLRVPLPNPNAITPALTPEEWTAREFAEQHGGFSADLIGDRLSVRIDDLAFESMGHLVERRHALAALALHEQPFGFTHDDVAILESAVGHLSAEWRAMYGHRVSEIAAKIAVLLPLL